LIAAVLVDAISVAAVLGFPRRVDVDSECVEVDESAVTFAESASAKDGVIDSVVGSTGSVGDPAASMVGTAGTVAELSLGVARGLAVTRAVAFSALSPSTPAAVSSPLAATSGAAAFREPDVATGFDLERLVDVRAGADTSESAGLTAGCALEAEGCALEVDDCLARAVDAVLFFSVASVVFSVASVASVAGAVPATPSTVTGSVLWADTPSAAPEPVL
jgi:hypothetical protein